MVQDEGVRNLTAIDAPPPVKMTLPGIIGEIIKLVAHHTAVTSRTYHEIASIPSYA